MTTTSRPRLPALEFNDPLHQGDQAETVAGRDGTGLGAHTELRT